MSSKTHNWRADPLHSYHIGTGYRSVTVPSEVHPLPVERVWQIWIELIFVTICHAANWYRVRDVVLGLSESDLELLHPKRLAELSPSSFRQLFGRAYESDNLRARERCRLLRAVGSAVHDWPSDEGAAWLRDGKVTLAGDDGLYRWLDALPPFAEDPLRKKARVLAHQLVRYQLIEATDVGMLLPAIDYHLIRFYVRTGRIYKDSAEMSERLAGSGDQPIARLEYLTHLRRAVEEAMWYTAAGADMRMDHLNHIEWQIARSFCVRSRARCHESPLANKPIDEIVSKLTHTVGGHCPLASTCRGSTDLELRSLVEPRSARAFY